MRHRSVRLYLREATLARILMIFLLGCAAGTAAAILVPSGLNLLGWAAVLEGDRPSYWRCVLVVGRFPLFVLLCGQSRRGRKFLCPAVLLRGALLSYLIGALLVRYHASGLLLALVWQLCRGLLPLPLVFWLAGTGLQDRRTDGRERLFALTAGYCLLCALLERFVTPPLLSGLLMVLEIEG